MRHHHCDTSELIAAIDAAVSLGEPRAITTQLSRSLERVVREGRVQLPPAVYEVDEARYARRLLHLSERYGYSVIAMTWAPGQGTLIHDHAGLWCVESVWSGCLEVTPYDLVETLGDTASFRAQRPIRAHLGTTGTLIPPFEYHTIRNAENDTVAVSVHVYGGMMNQCTVFEPVEANWYMRKPCLLESLPA
jgi:predicted metal-dependent enzyme (double-stranded beta helix superfamily)